MSMLINCFGCGHTVNTYDKCQCGWTYLDYGDYTKGLYRLNKFKIYVDFYRQNNLLKYDIRVRGDDFKIIFEWHSIEKLQNFLKLKTFS